MSNRCFVLEMLQNFKYIKTHLLSPYQADVIEGVKEGAEQVTMIRKGLMEGIPAKDLIDEL